MHDYLHSIGRMAIIVMGVSGSGKSTLGLALAAQLDCPFLEGDDFHAPESVAKMRAGIPLTDADRWPWLDRLGGAVAAPVGFVLPNVDPDELLRRMTARTHHYMPPSLLTSQLATLERL